MAVSAQYKRNTTKEPSRQLHPTRGRSAEDGHGIQRRDAIDYGPMKAAHKILKPIWHSMGGSH